MCANMNHQSNSKANSRDGMWTHIGKRAQKDPRVPGASGRYYNEGWDIERKRKHFSLTLTMTILKCQLQL